MLLSILSLVFLVHSIQGSNQCARTNRLPSRDCTIECTPQIGCYHKRKKCLCDGDCGFSCVYPRQRCTKPNRVRNGRIIYNSFKFNGTQRVVCNKGYKLYGSSVRICRGNGYWDGRPARCKRPQVWCQDPGTNGLLLRQFQPKKKYKLRTRLRFYCPPWFTLRGAKELVCRSNGNWSQSLPRCIAPKCPRAVLPANTKVIIPRNWQRKRVYGTQLNLLCDFGYVSTKRGFLVCDGVGWRLEPSDYKCFPKSCPHPGRPRNGNVKGKYQFSEQVKYSCHFCYKLNGPSYRICQANQKWSDRLPTCDPVTCPLLTHPSHGYLVSNSQQCGDVVQYRCDHGYHVIGSAKRLCQSDGTWTGQEPVCRSNKNPLPLTTLPSKTVVNRKIQVPTRTADILTPSLSNIFLNSTCGAPSIPLNARVVLVSGLRTIFIVCKSNFAMLNPGKMICGHDGRWWTLKNVKCLAQSCPAPRTPKNGHKNGLSYFIGESVTFTCDACYTMVGDGKITCLANKTWSKSEPSCELKTCSRLNDTQYATVSYISHHCKSIATYTCKSSLSTMSGSRKRVCNTGGLWEGSAPTCSLPNVNIALWKTVFLSSQSKKYSNPPHFLVDGKKNGGYIHTNEENGPWVRVDLGRESRLLYQKN
ncbi:CUB and sushi domain-containing protein 3-like isoform X2 [Xenia sp. Carnegie-2017]|uniref:CUB and sushi domain-containing protein 3-like isoform X2 n=1 Tax=Xenia sp. Carnegie-2017 TaxID=2897299 RepID=UPI001F03DB5D|nr:CUB and sushi domain-containing protein 3-like isoform X2 [Xenia sp. Carnegie-2017]